MITKIPILKIGQKLDDIEVTESLLISLTNQFLSNKEGVPCVWGEASGKVADVRIEGGFLYCIIDFPAISNDVSVEGKKVKSSIDFKIELKKISIE